LRTDSVFHVSLLEDLGRASQLYDYCGRVILHAAPKAVPIDQSAGFVSVDSEMRLDLC
jgi:hypothetical protein